MILRILLGLVILSLSCIAHAQNPAGKVMHRSGAGQLDSTGWTDAKSTEGKFSVRLPGPFDDFTVKNSDETLQAGQFFAIGTVTSEGVSFSVTRASYDNPDAAQHYFRNWQTGGALGGNKKTAELLSIAALMLLRLPPRAIPASSMHERYSLSRICCSKL